MRCTGVHIKVLGILGPLIGFLGWSKFESPNVLPVSVAQVWL